ncbi:pre-mRNA-processing factor 19 [Acrasis kona]|uniref:Pre-mRNA-processing factor 19 n=1 Tax=Acrasis kona TaxID=1008807 RepID=A0AAW2ZPM9_9EUKA
MFCSISGQVPREPVVSTKSGLLFDKDLIHKWLQENDNTCPITKQPLSTEDLVSVVSKTPTQQPRSITATSIPGMLQSLHNEWDAVMLETFTLKQQLETARQELAHTLYQHDAACRVIARLMKERDDAKNALTNAKNKMEEDPTPDGLSQDVINKLVATSSTLSSGRKVRQVPTDLKTETQIKGVAGVIAVGGASQVALYDQHHTEAVATFKPQHAVNSVLFHPKQNLLIASGDKISFWDTVQKSSQPLRTLSTNQTVTGASIHPSGDFLLYVSSSAWNFSDVSTGTLLYSNAVNQAQLTCCEFHPDGLIFATGTSGQGVKIWDIKSKQIAAQLDQEGSIVGLSFSENGYYLATASENGTVMLWDLRKVICISTVQVEGGATSVKFDHSGVYLAVGTSSGNIIVHTVQNKQLTSLNTIKSSSQQGPTFVCWGNKKAEYLVSVGGDLTVKVYE